MDHAFNAYEPQTTLPITEMWRFVFDRAERAANEVPGISFERDKLSACATDGYCTWMVSFSDDPLHVAKALRNAADAIERSME